MAPVGIVLHELGHYLTALALGFSPQLNAASVSGGTQRGQDPDWMVAAQAAAGPIVTIAIILFAARRFRQKPARLWALALAATAPLRFLVSAGYLMISVYVWWVGGRMGGADFDEAKVAEALGAPLAPLLALQITLLFGLWAWLLSRISSGNRITSVVAILVGGLAAIGVWMAVAPILFELA